MRTRDERMWSALLKKRRRLAAELNAVLDAEAEAIVAARTDGARGSIGRIRRDAGSKARPIKRALTRLEHEIDRLHCGCVCDRCYATYRHCASAPCKHDPALQRRL